MLQHFRLRRDLSTLRLLFVSIMRGWKTCLQVVEAGKLLGDFRPNHFAAWQKKSAIPHRHYDTRIRCQIQLCVGRSFDLLLKSVRSISFPPLSRGAKFSPEQPM